MPTESIVVIAGRELKIRPLNVAQVKEFETQISEFDDSQPRNWPAQLLKFFPVIASAVAIGGNDADEGWLMDNVTVADLSPLAIAIFFGSGLVKAGEKAPAAGE